ncbi:hypothetical protein N9Z27_00335 [Alphaproteobacteria bacterium]|nr:hypothetical protein [Alphaproteobacteria bacterium]
MLWAAAGVPQAKQGLEYFGKLKQVDAQVDMMMVEVEDMTNTMEFLAEDDK